MTEVFQVVFGHLFYNSASCCSFLLHVVASLLCILVSRQLVLLSALPEFLHSFFVVKKCVPGCSPEKIHLD